MAKNLPANAGDARDVGSIPGLRRSPRELNGTHSSILAWRILWTEEPGRLQSMGSQRVGHGRAQQQKCSSVCQGCFFRIYYIAAAPRNRVPKPIPKTSGNRAVPGSFSHQQPLTKHPPGETCFPCCGIHQRQDRELELHCSVISYALPPHGLQPTRLSVHGILQARILE